MKQGGQISNFKFIEEEGTKYFVKSWDESRYNSHSLLFQEAMLDLDIPLRINKIVSKDDDKREATFEYINETPWNFDIFKARMLGESMAKIHNWAATSKKVKSLNIPEKKSLYDNMNGSVAPQSIPQHIAVCVMGRSFCPKIFGYLSYSLCCSV